MSVFVPDSAQWQAVRLSLLVAWTAVAVSLPAGVAVAWVLERCTFRGRWVLETLVNLPLVLPPVVTGYLLLVLFGRQGALGSVLHDWLGVRLVFDWKGAALAAGVMAFPLMVRALRVGLAGVDRRLELAARTLGAGPVDAFFSVTLPLARNAVIAAIVLAFARSLGEFGATIMIAGSIPGETRTIPLEIYSRMDTPRGAAESLPLIIAAVVLSAAALIISERLQRRRPADAP